MDTERPHDCMTDPVPNECPTCRVVHGALFATNLGAGGIDYRCAPHLADVLADPDNIAAGVTRDDYVLVDPDDHAAVCEACA
jgi:hypothetical protein